MTRYRGKCPKCGTRLIARPKKVTLHDLWEDLERLVKQLFATAEDELRRRR